MAVENNTVHNQPTLNLFEHVRREQEVIPGSGEDLLFNIGPYGRIHLRGLRSDPNDYRFDIRILTLRDQINRVFTGSGNFELSGENNNIESPYHSMSIESGGELTVNDELTITNSSGQLVVAGTLEFADGNEDYPVRINITNGGRLIMETGSTLTIGKYVKFNVDGELRIFGTVNIDITSIEDLIYNDNILIDSSVIMNVSGLSNGDRTFSFTDYEAELRTFFVQRHIQGVRTVGDFGQIAFDWEMGDHQQPSHVLRLTFLTGNLPLGDFRLSFIGIPHRTFPDMRTLSHFTINRRATLHITNEFMGSKYYMPELYIGVNLGNTRVPAQCVVNGNIIVHGKRSRITIDRGGTLTISESASIRLENEGVIRGTLNDKQPVVFINGRLYVDTLEQLEGFDPENIVIGPQGKIVVLNTHDTDERKVLFSTPNGIKETTLYKVFKDRITYIEFHIPENCGIKIDHESDSPLFFSRGMRDWYVGRTLERAIKDELIIWHEGAFIELDHQIISWVGEDSTLLTIGNIFTTYGTFPKDRLQNAVNRLIFAGIQSIVFRFTNGETFLHEVLLDLTHCRKRSTFFRPQLRNPPMISDDDDEIDWNTKDHFVLITDNDGELFIRNRVSSAQVSKILDEGSQEVPLISTRTPFAFVNDTIIYERR